LILVFALLDKKLSRLVIFLFLSDVYCSYSLLSIDFLGAGSPAFRRPSNQARDSWTTGTFQAARRLHASHIPISRTPDLPLVLLKETFFLP